MGLTGFRKAEKKLNSLEVQMIKFDLENMKSLVKKLGLDLSRLKTIHITGTNGKGSVAAFVTSILTEAGYKVGTYTSPHVVEITERIKLNDKNISEKGFERLAEKVFACIKKNRINASYFEALTAMAFLFFIEKKVDFVVAEVGLGGRLDATNLLTGKINVFTSISLEHTQTLGDTIEKIATEKAGIIKEGSVTVIGEKNEGLETVLKFAQSKNSRIAKVQGRLVSGTPFRQEFMLEKPKNTGPFATRLVGFHQAENASLALAAALELEKLGTKIPQEAIEKGLLKAHNPGRLEVLQKKPLIVVDCAHNPGGFEALLENLKIFKYEKLFLVFGAMDDKDVEKMLSAIPFDELVLTKPKEKRALDPKKLQKKFPQAKIFPDAVKALSFAKKTAGPKDMVMVAGSIYLAGEVLKEFKKIK